MIDLDTVLKVITFALIAVVAVPVLRSKRKDAVIAEQEKVLESHERRINALEEDLKGAQERADRLASALVESEKHLAAARAAYDEQSKFTARPAVENFERILLEHQRAVQDRHKLMIQSLERVTQALDDIRSGLRTPPAAP